MHVDVNNHGPSYIIALGNYTGGALWTYDRNSTGNYMEVTEATTDYGELQVGSKVPGRIHDIRYKSESVLCAMGRKRHLLLP
jgi:hypothetical protein